MAYNILRIIPTIIQTALNLKANLASPAFTGTPSLPTGTTGVTQTPGDSTTKISTTAFATAAAAAAQAASQPLAAVLTGTTASFTTTQATKLSTVENRANHTGTQLSSTISDFNSASRAQTEAELAAGTGIVITPSDSGATRTLTLSGSEASLGNRLINGSFRVNQAGLTSVADAAYHLDQWYGLTESGNITIAQQVNQEDGQVTNLRMTQPDVTAKRIGSAQPIESINCRDLRGKTVSLRARVRCSSSQVIRWAIVEWTGTADTITKDIVNTWASTTFTPGNFFIATTTTISNTGTITPSASTWTDILGSATISSSSNNIIVFIWSEGTLAQNATLDIGSVQLTQGAQAPFEIRSIGVEFAMAQRYSRSLGVASAIGLSTTTTNAALISNGIPLRVSPTLSLTSGFTVANGAGTGVSATTVAVASSSPDLSSVLLNFTVASGLTVGQGSYLTAATAGARLLAQL